jgi:hypothetical protein
MTCPFKVAINTNNMPLLVEGAFFYSALFIKIENQKFNYNIQMTLVKERYTDFSWCEAIQGFDLSNNPRSSV